MKKKIFLTILFFSVTLICINILMNDSYATTYNFKYDDDSKRVVYRVEPNMDTTSFMTAITSKLKVLDTDVIKLYRKSDNGYQEVTGGIVKTGMLAVKNLQSIDLKEDGRYEMRAERIYRTSIIGDISEDGLCDQRDLSSLIRHSLGLTKFILTDKAILKSADFYDDGDVNISDISYLIRYILTGEFPVMDREDYTMQLSETSGTTTCPNTTTFTVTNPTGGRITALSSNSNVATASVTDSTITVTPVGQGTTTITVYSEETARYKAGSATYTITVNKGTGYITLSATEGVVLKGETITFNVTSKHGDRTEIHIANTLVVDANIRNGVVTVTGVGAGSTTITVKAPEDNSYTEATAVYTVRCTENQQDYTMQLSETSGTTTCPNTRSFTVTNPTGGKIRAISSNSNVASASVSGSTITVSPNGQGTTTIIVSSAATEEYKEGNAIYTITVNKGTGYVVLSSSQGSVAKGGTSSFSIQRIHGSHVGIRIANTNIVDASIEDNTIYIVGKGSGTTTITVIGYEDARYTEATAVYTVTCTTNQQNYTMQLSETSGTTTCPYVRRVAVTNPTGGKITATSSNNNIATASVSDSTINITPVGQGTTTITISSEATDDYKAGSATYTITVNKGTGYITLSATEGTVRVGEQITFSIVRKHGTRVQMTNNNTYVVNASLSSNVVTLTGVGPGSTTIEILAPEDNGYSAAVAIFSVNCRE